MRRPVAPIVKIVSHGEEIVIENARHLFDIPADVAYLNLAYMSPLPRASVAAGVAALEGKAHPWNTAPRDFFAPLERARTLFANLIGADADGIAVVPSAGYGISIAARNLKLQRGQTILTLAEEFPANVYPWRRLAQTCGARMVTVTRNQGEDWTSALLAAIDGNTGLVAVPNCHWTDGARVDLERVSRAAKANGAALVLDLTQSAGAMPVDVKALGADFAVAATYKWLLGPYALGFLYVAPQWRNGEPLEESWSNRKDAENFARLVDYDDAYMPGARRFDMGEKAQHQLMPVALASLEQLTAWGVASVAETLAAKTAAIAARAAEELGCRSEPAASRARHYLGLRRDGLPADLVARLAAEKVYVSVRGDAIRVTPHVYTTDGDIDRFIAALKKALA